MEFQKASKEQAKLRLAVFGPSGSGKTFTSLRLATGLGGEIAVIDTERGSASKYADRFTFDVLELHGNQRNIAIYCEAIAAAQANGYNVLIIDSLTHAWHELLAEVDRIARAKYRGNTWSAWSEGTPKQRHLVDAILGFDGHVIATMRTKTEWTTTTDKGKTRPVRVGLAPEQGKGIEYEFDILMELTPEHDANIIKDRTGKYQDKSMAMPGEELGQELAAWLKEGVAPRKREKRAPVRAEEPKGNGKRPLAPDKLKAFLVRKVAEKPTEHQEIVATQGQRGLVLGKLEECFAPAEDAMDKRHAVLAWLVDKESTTDLTAAEAGAILDWLLDKDADEGTYDLHPKAAAEAEAVYREATAAE